MLCLPTLYAVTRHVPIVSEDMSPVTSRQALDQSLTVLIEEPYDPSLGNHDSLASDIEPESMDLWVNFQGLQCTPITLHISEVLS